MSMIDDWVKTEQDKHPTCHCGCGEEIIIRPAHHCASVGIPYYKHGHFLKILPRDFKYITDWIIAEQGSHICSCGCGEEIKIQKKHHEPSYDIPKYIRGHQSKGKPVSDKHRHNLSIAMTGKTHSDETKMKVSNATKGEKNPMFGCNHTEESKQKMSKAQTGKYDGENNPHYGKKHSDESKQKISKSRIGKYAGENNPMWKGGISYIPYCYKFNNTLKERVRDRDNRTCQNCGVKENGIKLAIHHVHYDKENCYPDLITICNSCNSKANGNRDYWEAYYMNILDQRGLINWS